ncbi:TfuA-like protein [Actinoallomurus sp. CA-142502]|uniref:TfuA-like protein n=1 Tax=Actinoallomurus sp. CA-142502 TaxID=3239885 RepID=UPI003D89E4BC
MRAPVVFVGPTLPRAEVAALLPAARILPPVRHGDLLRLDAGAGDTVLIIDGLFLQAASVRHREIMYLLQRGVTVAGSSSMGALRAAELWPYGMRGFGEIFRLYRDGEIDGDDEVAIVHGTAEDDYRAYSDPMVGIRIALRDAAAAGAISDRDAGLMLDVAIAIPFRSRGFRALESAVRAHVPARSVEAFRTWRSAHDTDAKAADARLLLAAAATGDSALCPAGPGDRPVRNVHTWMFDRWEHRFHGTGTGDGWVADADAAAALRLVHPAFPDLHRRYVLSRVAGLDPDHPALVEGAVAAARAKGLRVPGPDPASTDWLTARDLALPEDEALATLLVRAFGVVHGGSRSRWDLPPDLRTPAMMSWGREVVTAARRCHDRLLGPADGGPRRRFRAEVTDQVIAGHWGCDPGDLTGHAWDRGIADLPALRRLAEPFVALLKNRPTGTIGMDGDRVTDVAWPRLP